MLRRKRDWCTIGAHMSYKDSGHLLRSRRLESHLGRRCLGILSVSALLGYWYDSRFEAQNAMELDWLLTAGKIKA
jgi:hypothetical protein